MKKSGLVLGLVLLTALRAGDLKASEGVNPVESFLHGKSCELWDDEQGIPHIHATEEKVGIACLGYIHARDRAWQMEFFRRTAQGRKAEVFGAGSIKSDFVMRFLDLPTQAKAIFKDMVESEQKILWAYSYGVNRGLRAALKKGVYEFKEYGYEPEDWRPEDTISVILLQSFDQTRRSFELQLEQKAQVDRHGSSAAWMFSLDGLPWSTTILKTGEYPKASEQQRSMSASNRELTHQLTRQSTHQSDNQSHKKKISDFWADYPSLWGGAGAGSNNWVLSQRYSQSGNAWLENDPHLHLGYPPFWEWVHLDVGENKIDAIGATLPGVPIIVSGANRHVSWGLTNAFLPVARLSAVPEQELRGAQSYRPLIWVKVWKFKVPFFFKTFRKTNAGTRILPVDAAPSGKALALRWTGFDLQGRDIMGFFDLVRSTRVSDADQALARVGVPSWNFVFADDQGGVGYRAIGRIPRFESSSPGGIPSESLAEVESSKAFAEPLSPDEMPHVLNPERGYVVTANNPQWPLDSRWSSGRSQLSSFRAFRIEELLKQNPHHDLESQQKIQCDVQAVDARFILPKLLEVLQGGLQKSELLASQGALEVLKQWNFETNLHCTACGLYRRWVEKIDSLQKLNSSSLYRKLPGGADLEFQKAVVSTFQESLKELGFFKEQKLPGWGTIHRNSFSHLANQEFHSVPSIPTPGDENTVNPGTATWNGESFEHTAGASQRLLVELSSPPKVYSVLAGNNQDLESRDISDPHSEWQRWAQCQVQRRNFPVDWSKVNQKSAIDL